MQKLFEYAILFNPIQTKEDRDNGKKPQTVLLKDVTRLLAEDQNEVTLIAAREIAPEYLGVLSQVTIAVRPF